MIIYWGRALDVLKKVPPLFVEYYQVCGSTLLVLYNAALGGYEQLNKDKKLLPDGATLLDRSRFIYGGAVYGSMEVFLTDRILFLIKAQGRFLFGTDVHCFRPAVSAGLRFNF